MGSLANSLHVSLGLDNNSFFFFFGTLGYINCWDFVLGLIHLFLHTQSRTDIFWSHFVK